MTCCRGSPRVPVKDPLRYDSSKCSKCGYDMINEYIQSAQSKTKNGTGEFSSLERLACPKCKTRNGFIVRIKVQRQGV